MFRFHDKHGVHVQLSPCKTIARRSNSFANAVVFSHRPISVSETFLFEITEQEKGWSGHVRCGVTLFNPNDITRVPHYLLPDLVQKGKTWVFAVKPTTGKPLGDEQLRDRGTHIYRRQHEGDKDVNDVLFLSEGAREAGADQLPTDVRSRIGVKVNSLGEISFYINGQKFGPCASGLPLDKDLYVAIDVYGITKEVKIIQCGGGYWNRTLL